MHARGPGHRDEAVATRYLRPAVVVANILGLGISVYLTFVHFAAAPLVCSASGQVNCELVLGSGYGVIAGTAVPTSAAGIVWFGGGAALGVLGWRGGLMAWSVIGILTVLYLVFVEIVELGAICIWCTAAHILVVVIFLLTVTVREPEP